MTAKDLKQRYDFHENEKERARQEEVEEERMDIEHTSSTSTTRGMDGWIEGEKRNNER